MKTLTTEKAEQVNGGESLFWHACYMYYCLTDGNIHYAEKTP